MVADLVPPVDAWAEGKQSSLAPDPPPRRHDGAGMNAGADTIEPTTHSTSPFGDGSHGRHYASNLG